MEEEKAAAYYDELTRKGEGAARFKQGLGFSSNSTNNSNNPPSFGSALASSSSSFLSTFVKPSSTPNTNTNESNKQATIESIHNKLNSKNKTTENNYRHRDRDRDRDPSRRRSRSTSREKKRRRSRSRSRGRSTSGSPRRRERKSRRTRRSRSASPRRRMSRSRERRRRRSRNRSRSRSVSPRRSSGSREKRRGGSRSLSPRRRESKRGSRSLSPRERRRERKERNGKDVDYAKLIEGYDAMTPAERVKAKMKLQLNETAKKDATIGTGEGWERFEFDKEAPVDDEEVEAADDDAALVEHIGKSFRFSTVQARREEQIKAAHDEAMFGAPVLLPSSIADAVADTREPELEDDRKESNENFPVTNLLSEKVLAKQQGSWRDRARKVKDSGTTS